jgi:two-component system, cell cycle response regulator DivK
MAATAAAPVILLVDDYDDALEIYTTYLTFHGYRVQTARDGEEALQVAQTCVPALVLMDLRMPILDGTSAMRRMRRLPGFDKIPVIALTAHALDGERVEALSQGFDAVIPKPCLPDELLRAVQMALASRDSAAR